MNSIQSCSLPIIVPLAESNRCRCCLSLCPLSLLSIVGTLDKIGLRPSPMNQADDFLCLFDLVQFGSFGFVCVYLFVCALCNHQIKGQQINFCSIHFIHLTLV